MTARLRPHPLLQLRTGGSGIRRPALIGTRLDVWQVIETLRAHDNDIKGTAAYFAITPAQVRACVDYYADFQDEIDAYVAAEMEAAERERKRESNASRRSTQAAPERSREHPAEDALRDQILWLQADPD